MHSIRQAMVNPTGRQRNELLTSLDRNPYTEAGDKKWWGYEAVFRYAVEERYPRISHPTVVLNPHGGLYQETLAAAKDIPGAVLVDIPDLSHVEAQDGTRPCVSSFLHRRLIINYHGKNGISRHRLVVLLQRYGDHQCQKRSGLQDHHKDLLKYQVVR